MAKSFPKEAHYSITIQMFGGQQPPISVPNQVQVQVQPQVQVQVQEPVQVQEQE